MITNRETLLLSILRWINGTERKIAPVSFLLVSAKTQGWAQITTGELVAELEALARDEGLLEKVFSLTGDSSTWRITNKGRKHLEELGIA